MAFLFWFMQILFAPFDRKRGEGFFVFGQSPKTKNISLLSCVRSEHDDLHKASRFQKYNKKCRPKHWNGIVVFI
jgi:hypothetical protein